MLKESGESFFNETSQQEWQTRWGPSLDQPIVNHLMWNGDIDRAGIKYGLTGCDGGFFTMQWCVSEAKVLLNEHNQVVSKLFTSV
jgi:hypothetical protein